MTEVVQKKVFPEPTDNQLEGGDDNTIVAVDAAPADAAPADAAVAAPADAVDDDGMREAEKFDHPAEYWLACIGYAVGFGNIWRFPYMAYTMGGAAFLIPYFISLFFIAMPMYMVETLFGQLIRTKLNERYGTINKMFWGIAITQFFVGFFTVIYYVTLMAWSFSLFFDAWKSPFPWVMTEAELAIKTAAIKADPTKYKAGIEASNIWNPDYFYKDTLNKSDNIRDTGTLNGHLVFCMFLSYFVIYFSAWKGVKSTGKMVWVTCTLPYVILTILLIKGLTLEGSGNGLKYLVIPNWSKIGDIAVWQAAAIQILFSSGVAFGPIIYYGGSRNRDEKILTASFWIPVANSATSFYAALTVFCFVGHVANVLKVDIDQVTTQSVSLAFVAYPGLLNLLAWKNFWAVIFFLMLVTLGVDSAFGYVDYIMEFMLDAFPVILTKMRKEFVCVIVCFTCFISSLMFVTDSGYYVFNMFDGYACGVSLYFCLIMECIVIGWIFGIEKLSIIAKRTTDEQIPMVVMLLVKFFIPLLTFINIILYFIGEFSAAKQVKRNWGPAITWLGRLLWIVPIGLAFIGTCWKPPMADIYDLIEKQHGIRFNNERMGDHSFEEKASAVEMKETKPEKADGIDA